MADVAIDTAIHSATEIRTLRSGPVWTSDLVGYSFFISSGQDVFYRKTEDGGATWDARVDVSGNISATNMDVWFDQWTPGDSGTLIHMWWMDAVGDLVHYRSLDTSDDSLGSIITVFTGVSLFFPANRDGAAISGTKAVGGNLYVQWWGDIFGEHGFERSTDGGDNWTSRTDAADGDPVDEILCLPDGDSADNEDIVMIYWDRSADEIFVKKYDDSMNSWGSTSISGSMVDEVLILNMSAVVRHSDGHIIVAAWNALDLSTSDLKVWDIALATPTITAKLDVVTNATDCAGAALFIDQNNDDLYCAYLGNEDSSETLLADPGVTAFYKTISAADFSADNSWGSQTAYQENTSDDERYISAGHSTPGSAAGRFEPQFFNDDLSDLFVNFNNSVVVGAAAAAAPTEEVEGGPAAHGAVVMVAPGRMIAG